MGDSGIEAKEKDAAITDIFCEEIFGPKNAVFDPGIKGIAAKTVQEDNAYQR